jgi:hypothetical protein
LFGRLQGGLGVVGRVLGVADDLVACRRQPAEDAPVADQAGVPDGVRAGRGLDVQLADVGGPADVGQIALPLKQLGQCHRLHGLALVEEGQHGGPEAPVRVGPEVLDVEDVEHVRDGFVVPQGGAEHTALCEIGL